MDEDSFGALFNEVEPRLRRSLIAWYGPGIGRDAAMEALSWAWEHRDRLDAVDNVAGYLFRVGQSAASRRIREQRRVAVPRDDPAEDHDGSFEPGLDDALASLSAQQRAAVLLVHGFGYSFRDAAEQLGISLASLRTHVNRGLSRLREQLEVTDDVTS